jgi:hypothetical protein
MRYRLRTMPQFKLAGIMLALVWLGVSFAGWRLPYQPTMADELVAVGLRWIPIPAAIGALFGYRWQGILAGFMMYPPVVACLFFAAWMWGD